MGSQALAGVMRRFLPSPAGAHGGQIACEEDLMARVFSSWEEGLPASRSRDSPSAAVPAMPAPPCSCSAPLPKLMQGSLAVSAESFTRFHPMLAPTRQESEGGPGLSGVQHGAPYDQHLKEAGLGLGHGLVGERDSRGRRYPATLRTSGNAVATQATDASVWRLPADSVSPGAGSLRMAGLRLGKFRFKGSATLSMVNVTPTALAARR